MIVTLPIRISGMLEGDQIKIVVPAPLNLTMTFMKSEITSQSSLMDFLKSKVQENIGVLPVNINQVINTESSPDFNEKENFSDEILTNVSIDVNTDDIQDITDQRNSFFSTRCMPSTTLILRIISDIMFTIMGYFALEVSIRSWSQPWKSLTLGIISTMSFSMAMVMYIFSDASESTREFAHLLEHRLKCTKQHFLEEENVVKLSKKGYTLLKIIQGLLLTLTITDSLLLSVSGAQAIYALGEKLDSEGEANLSISILKTLFSITLISTLFSRLAFDSSFCIRGYKTIKEFVNNRFTIFTYSNKVIDETQKLITIQDSESLSVENN